MMVKKTKKTVKLEKSICRPANVAMMIVYDIGYSVTTTKILGYGFKNMVSYIKDGALIEYRALSELKGFKDMLDIVFADKKRANKILEDFNEDYKNMQDSIKKAKKIPFKPSAIIALINSFNDSFKRAWAPTMLCQWFPLWVDKKELSNKDKKRVEELIAARHARDMSFVYSQQFFDNIFTLINKNVKDCGNLEVATPNELNQIIKTKVCSDEIKARLKERENGCVVFQKEVYPISQFDELAIFLEKYNVELPDPEEKIDVKMFKGSSASLGKAQGKVRLLYSKSDMAALQEGEIVVSPMTSSYFDPVLPRAAAIVTDEGGITCHAAIISRELGIPSIIGTKVATKALRTGDLIEVDADNGVVKVLKKAKF
jgi:phosphohistidine swiveling domain-containing protein